MKRAFLTSAVLCLSGMAQADEKLVYPIIPNVGGVIPLPDAAEQPGKGAKVVFDILANDIYRSKFATDKNPNLAIIGELRKAGVEIFVCGQALAYKGFERSEVLEGVKVASAALTVVINLQADGYSYVLAH